MPKENSASLPAEESETQESTEITEVGGGGNLTSPEGILMLCAAGLFDAIGFVSKR